MEHVSKFIDFLIDNNLEPQNHSDIRPDNTWRDYQITGDSSRKLKGYYILTIDGGYVSGAAGDRRTGETIQYRGQPTRKLTDDERREYARKMDEMRKAKEADIQGQQDKVAMNSQNEWKQATQSEHEYLKNKGVDSEFTRVNRAGYLLAPMYHNGTIQNLQSIGADGVKLFKKGGKKKGCYLPLAKAGESKDTLYFCEGLATGKSIRKATGGMVLVAFDCGNLAEVVKDKRQENPDSLLVICADNDAAKEVNAGLIAGRKAAEDHGGVCIYPVFEEGQDGSDFNDYDKIHGTEALGEYIQAQINNEREVLHDDFDATLPQDWFDEIPPIEAYNDEAKAEIALYEEKEEKKPANENWKQWLAKDSKGNIKPRSLNNVMLMLEHSPKFKDMFCYDEFADEKKIIQCPPWDDPKKFTPRTLSDEDNTWLCGELEKHGITLGMDSVKKALNAVVTKKRRNPAKEYFSKLEWDGVKRVDNWLFYYLGCEFDNPEYVSMVGKKFLTAIVTRVMNAGAKFDHVLILEGGQGVGKSSILRELATIHGKSYFTDAMKVTDLGKPAAVPITQGRLIVEFAEMTGLNKMDMDTFKQQITIQEDRIVKKYANEPSDFPRQYVMVGSINPKEGYLDDPTGLRRFWPVKVGSEFKMEELKNDKEQLFAEAMELYRNKYPIYMNREEAKLLEGEQETRKLISPWMPDLEELTENKDFVSQKEIWEALGFERSRRSAHDAAIISKIMTELGYEPARKQIHSKRIRGWGKV